MKILLVGEAYGEKEEEQGRPFVGASGFHLDQMLAVAGIARSECYVTNVFNLRPYKNDLANISGTKEAGIPGYPAIKKSKYILKKYYPELQRLYSEINTINPNVVVALGATPVWALLLHSGIKNIRGAATLAHPTIRKLIPNWGGKIVPTYHPAAMLRDFTLRPIIISDLDKARRESEYPDIRLPRRQIWVSPTLQDLYQFEQQFILPSSELTIDIETKQDQITCIGFAPTGECAIVVPFWDRAQSDGNYWRSLSEEIAAWNWVRRMCGLEKEIIFQNGMYDMQFLWRVYGIPVPFASDDTMLMHHAHQPEMEKSLGFLGTIYTDEAQWKFRRKKSTTVKKED